MKKFTYVMAFLVISLVAMNSVQAGIIVGWDADPMHLEIGNQDNNTGFLVGHRANGTSAVAGSVTMLNGHNGAVTQHQLALDNFISYSVRLRGNPDEPLNLFNNYAQYSVSDIKKHPSYGGLSFGYDVAVLHFYDEIPNINPLPLYEGEKNIGDMYRIIGGGMVGVPGGASPVLDGNIRGGYNTLISLNWAFEHDGVEDSYLRFRFDPPGSENYVDGEFYPWNHDSGGRFEKFNPETSRWELDALGTHRGTLEFGGLTSATPLPKSWIRQNMYSVPEPGSFILLAMGSAISLFTRRRR